MLRLLLSPTQINDALRLPNETTDGNERLCDGARETMRYLALVPNDKLVDGRHDWACNEFVFDEEVLGRLCVRVFVCGRACGTMCLSLHTLTLARNNAYNGSFVALRRAGACA